LTHEEISKDLARELYKNNPFKQELINQIPGDTVGLARQGDFYDLCRGGHVSNTGQLKNFKLLGISGSYWRADRNNQPLQRITGTAFFSQPELEEYLTLRQAAQLYDHRRIGKQLDLFSFHDEGIGFPFFHPRGKKIINLLVAYMRGVHEQHNYQEISTPTMLSDDLWQQSGHYEHYKDKMYFCCIDNRSYAIKPMNCPGAILVYKTRPHSYRELPLKLAEFGHVHRHELSGVLHGLLRVRAFTQDDAHIFCTYNQLEGEIRSILQIIDKTLAAFGFTQVRYAISTKPSNAFGNDELWQRATKALENALNQESKIYTTKSGEGAFYGPKIEVTIEDSMKRSWQCSTVQVDFFQPQNFDLTYITSAGTRERPVLIHQAIFGSLERFFAILLEHHKGNLPVWLAPIQARILAVTDIQIPYAELLAHQLRSLNLRIEIDRSSDPLAGQIKSAQQDRIPWMFIVGKKEAESNTFTLRYLNGKQEPQLTLEQFRNELPLRLTTT
ncbi:MAG TPA: threonine--tRNA ligase, partial [Candidatus Babeliaceae bacterium]|nr:threonine--tRNA ligase [Candidatus Babeliaceae bacterium]